MLTDIFNYCICIFLPFDVIATVSSVNKNTHNYYRQFEKRIHQDIQRLYSISAIKQQKQGKENVVFHLSVGFKQLKRYFQNRRLIPAYLSGLLQDTIGTVLINDDEITQWGNKLLKNVSSQRMRAITIYTGLCAIIHQSRSIAAVDIAATSLKNELGPIACWNQRDQQDAIASYIKDFLVLCVLCLPSPCTDFSQYYAIENARLVNRQRFYLRCLTNVGIWNPNCNNYKTLNCCKYALIQP